MRKRELQKEKKDIERRMSAMDFVIAVLLEFISQYKKEIKNIDKQILARGKKNVKRK